MKPDLLTVAPVSERLCAKLSDPDFKAIEKRLNEDEARLWRETDPINRKRVALSLGMHYRIAGVIENTGLVPADPPDDVHSMGRGALAAGGAYYYGDLVVDALAQAGIDLEQGMRGLDFGCSSGRVVRVLAAAHPELEWHGCDPIPSAIAWADENLRGIEFLTSPQEPPLPYEDARFDFAFAISIWSHFGEGVARHWLDELHRIIRPGGVLVLTTHGWHSIVHSAQTRARGKEQLMEISRALYERGFWYRPEFSERGDHGIVDAEWGTAFMTAEWLLQKACPNWGVAYFAPGRVEGNQDLFVLQRR